MTPTSLNDPAVDLTPERLLTVKQVAAILSVSPAWVRDHATRKEPRLKTVKVGKLLRFRPQNVLEFIDAWCR